MALLGARTLQRAAMFLESMNSHGVLKSGKRIRCVQLYNALFVVEFIQKILLLK